MKKNRVIDWSTWTAMETVSLGEAVCLSFNRNPKDIAIHESMFGPFDLRWPCSAKDKDLRDRYVIALSCIGKGIQRVKALRPDIPGDMPCVALFEFISWAQGKKIKLPRQLLTIFDERSHIKLNSTYLNRGADQIISYQCANLEALVRLANDLFKNPKDIPKQDAVALEIAKQFDFPINDGDGRAGARSRDLAAFIRPDSHRKRDRRASKKAK